MLRTLTALCGVRHVLLADAVLIRLPVSAGAGADPGLEAPAAQYLTTGRRWRHTTGQRKDPWVGEGGDEATPDGWVHLLLSGFQSDDDEDGTSVHPAHAAGVAHEVVQDCSELCPHLRNNTTVSASDIIARSEVRGRGCNLSKTALMNVSGRSHMVKDR